MGHSKGGSRICADGLRIILGLTGTFEMAMGLHVGSWMNLMPGKIKVQTKGGRDTGLLRHGKRFLKTRHQAFLQRRAEQTLSMRDEPVDVYGRSCTGKAMYKVQGKVQDRFRLTLPEYPYHIPAASKSNHSSTYVQFSDQPILQFLTWRRTFFLVDITPLNTAEPPTYREQNPHIPNMSSPECFQTSQMGVVDEDDSCRCHIIDYDGDKCGSIRVSQTWLSQHKETAKFEFIALSEAKSFTTDELPDWTYYIPKETIESEWDVYFVLLMENFPMEGCYRRVALGKVFKSAFAHSDDEWSEIALAYTTKSHPFCTTFYEL
ncbi:hypothetical protein MHUMG1_08208 [Metarhizium humberi]|uniref:Uncharacterized protein n=1 Tax=Metarhizium humberi TaxID=2596975 RepID=A0A9P8M5D1_9HYPO|nr:hypothetical protein MHUMG1_08208 [Metarhizium humberi]